MCGVDANTYALSRTATGMSTAFTTNATDLYVRFNFTNGPEHGDWLWPINGHSGIDIYVRDATTTRGVWRWATSSGNNCAKMGGRTGNSFGACLTGMAAVGGGAGGGADGGVGGGAGGGGGGTRDFLVYLPARSELASVEIGVLPSASAPRSVPMFLTPSSSIKGAVVVGAVVAGAEAAAEAVSSGVDTELDAVAEAVTVAAAEADSATTAAAKAAAKPVLWYGTSIVHGAASTHAGMQWTNQANRILNREGLNLGFR